MSLVLYIYIYVKYCIIIVLSVSIWLHPPEMQDPLYKAVGCLHMAHMQPPVQLKAPSALFLTEHKGDTVHIVALSQNNDMNAVCSCSAQIH